MGWRFRKSVKILPGIRLNFGKKGFTSATIGGKYAKTNVSKRGTYNTYSLPGTGISYRTKTSGGTINRESYSSDQPSLYWYCKNCYTANPPEHTLCVNCACEFTPNPQQSIQLDSNDGRNLAIIICSVVGLLFLAFVVGLIIHPSSRSPASESQVYQSPDTSKSLVSPNKEPVLDISRQSNVNKKPQTLKEIKKAVVISENANLRQSADSNGVVIQSLPEGSSVEVLKQKGAWFYVRAIGQTGWMHGNTIKYNDTADIAPVLTETYSGSTDSYSTSYPSSYPSSSSYGEKTVHVNGYFRKNGTYVNSYSRRAPRR